MLTITGFDDLSLYFAFHLYLSVLTSVNDVTRCRRYSIINQQTSVVVVRGRKQ